MIYLYQSDEEVDSDDYGDEYDKERFSKLFKKGYTKKNRSIEEQKRKKMSMERKLP